MNEKLIEIINEKLIEIINEIREERQLGKIKSLTPGLKLREDLGFDSLALASLTVQIEEVFDVDVFEDGVVYTVSEILEKLK